MKALVRIPLRRGRLGLFILVLLTLSNAQLDAGANLPPGSVEASTTRKTVSTIGADDTPAIPDMHSAMGPAASRSIPLTLDISDGYTFSGVTRSIKTGAVEFFDESPIGPFTISGHSVQHILSWNRAEVDDYLDCDPNLTVHSISESITNRVAVHYTADASETPGDILSASDRCALNWGDVHFEYA